MPTWLTWLIALARGILGIKEDAAVTNAKEAGANEQALKDEGAQHDETELDARAATDASAAIVRDLPGGDTVVPADSPIFKDNPDLPHG